MAPFGQHRLASLANVVAPFGQHRLASLANVVDRTWELNSRRTGHGHLSLELRIQQDNRIEHRKQGLTPRRSPIVRLGQLYRQRDEPRPIAMRSDRRIFGKVDRVERLFAFSFQISTPLLESFDLLLLLMMLLMRLFGFLLALLLELSKLLAKSIVLTA